MATIYKIKIKTVSPFIDHGTKHVEKILKEFLETYKDEKTGLGFESTEVKVEKQ